jgi:hypothetical protein
LSMIEGSSAMRFAICAANRLARSSRSRCDRSGPPRPFCQANGSQPQTRLTGVSRSPTSSRSASVYARTTK